MERCGRRAMIDEVLFVLTLLAALGCGAVAGVFLAFSTFVMKALARLPPAQGIAAMQSINVVAINPPFMAALFGTGAVCAILAAASPFLWQRPGAAWLLAGSALYLVGTVLVTLMANVPRNEALAELDPSRPESAIVWTRYLAGWTGWNHVRTAAALAAAAALILALA